MSIRIDDGVKLEVTPRSHPMVWGAVILLLEGIFTFFLYLSLAGRIFEADPTYSAAGVPKLLSYQGRLTDTSGNPLGGTGTTYCFRYSIYDAASGGNKVWPSGTPTTATTTVVDGVFSDQIGRMDALTYDFFSTSTVYLNVEVNQTVSTCGGTWESLTPRQQILSSGFAITSDSIYGDEIRTPTSTKVQIGTGAGVPSGQVLLSLDWKNVADTLGGSCSDNGAIWYNSNQSRALVCENSIIQVLSNPTSTIAGIKEQSTSTAISAGTVNFSASTNITINQTGNTLQFSVENDVTFSSYNAYDGLVRVAGQQTAGGVLHIQPWHSPNVTYDRVALAFNYSNTSNSTGSVTLSAWVGIYTRNVSTLSLLSSISTSYGISFSGTVGNNSLQAGPRLLTIGTTGFMSAGEYYLGINSRTTTAGANASFSQYLVSQVNSNFSGVFGNASNASNQFVRGLGTYSASTTAMPSSIAFSQVQGSGSLANRSPVIYFVSGTF